MRKSDRHLTDNYMEWLGSQIHLDTQYKRKHYTYNDLMRLMHDIEFVWFVPNDDNRIADGIELRHEFFTDYNHADVMAQGCSFLELVVALSRRIAWMMNGEAPAWAWELLKNLELHKFKDPLSPARSRAALAILDRVIWRTYGPDGLGGFFPLAWPEQDQRQIELWYQMSAYIDEMTASEN